MLQTRYGKCKWRSHLVSPARAQHQKPFWSVLWALPRLNLLPGSTAGMEVWVKGVETETVLRDEGS